MPHTYDPISVSTDATKPTPVTLTENSSRAAAVIRVQNITDYLIKFNAHGPGVSTDAHGIRPRGSIDIDVSEDYGYTGKCGALAVVLDGLTSYQTSIIVTVYAPGEKVPKAEGEGLQLSGGVGKLIIPSPGGLVVVLSPASGMPTNPLPANSGDAIEIYGTDPTTPLTTIGGGMVLDSDLLSKNGGLATLRKNLSYQFTRLKAIIPYQGTGPQTVNNNVDSFYNASFTCVGVIATSNQATAALVGVNGWTNSQFTITCAAGVVWVAFALFM